MSYKIKPQGETMTRRVILSILVLMGVICLGFSALAAASLIFAANRSQVGQSATPTATVEIPEVETVGNVPPAIAAQMDEIQKQVITLRGLLPRQTISREMLTPAELGEKVKSEFFAEYTPQDAAEDAYELWALGLLPENFDLIDLYTRLYSEQVAGFYDPKTKEMFVVGGDFGGVERMTYAHEFTHLLQDQVYDLREGLKFDDQYCEEAPERCAAVQSLVEGDASLAEQFWFLRHATEEDRGEIAQLAQTYASPVFDSAPQYLQDDFLFPYQRGMEFVQSIYDQGGWEAVNRAYENPPVTTEQILHPEKYPAEQGLPTSLPDLKNAAGNCTLISESGLGEWYLYLQMARGAQESWQQPETEARRAAAGWGGDRYAVYRCETGPLVVHQIIWDSEKDATEYYQAFSVYLEKRFSPTEDNPAETKTRLFVQQGSQTIYLSAPNADQLLLLQQAFGL